jgi:hypothetical protein
MNDRPHIAGLEAVAGKIGSENHAIVFADVHGSRE